MLQNVAGSRLDFLSRPAERRSGDCTSPQFLFSSIGWRHKAASTSFSAALLSRFSHTQLRPQDQKAYAVRRIHFPAMTLISDGEDF
jgi:hypothetical protein